MDVLKSHDVPHSREENFDCDEHFTQNVNLRNHREKHKTGNVFIDEEEEDIILEGQDEESEHGSGDFSNSGKGFLRNIETVKQVSVITDKDIIHEGSVTFDDAVVQPNDNIRKRFSQTFMDSNHVSNQTWSICTKMFTTKSEKPEIWNNCTKGFSMRGERSLNCHICSKYFTCESDLKFHMSAHFQENPVGCNDTIYKVKSSLEEHDQEFTDKKQYSYSEHSQSFPDISSLGIHVRAPLPSAKQPTCSVCFKKFSKKEMLKKHMLVHFDGIPFVCSTCGNEFKLKKHLLRHLKTHLMHKCKQCQLLFKSDIKLKKHMMLHESKDLYVCCVCSQRFSDEKRLAAHSCEKSAVSESSNGIELHNRGEINVISSHRANENLKKVDMSRNSKKVEHKYIENSIVKPQSSKDEDIPVSKESIVIEYLMKDDHIVCAKDENCTLVGQEINPIVDKPLDTCVKELATSINKENDVFVEVYPLIEDQVIYVESEIFCDNSP